MLFQLKPTSSVMTSEQLEKSLSSTYDETQFNTVVNAESAHHSKGPLLNNYQENG